MSTTVDEESSRVIVPKDHLIAEMLIPAGVPRDTLTEQMCLSLLQQSGVEITDAVVEAVGAMVTNPPPLGREHREVLARATPPEHGERAAVEWLISESQDAPEPDEDGEDENAVSHYDRSAYTVIKTGDIIGRIIDQTPGCDGRDVLGQTIEAIPGKPVVLKMDETVLRDASGQLIAQVDGVLDRGADSVYVRQLIEVPSYVDFSTGNIDFTGSVLIRQGVRDCFIVKATGSVEVKGLIEAATIECGGNLIARGGMAGRERGYASVGGNLIGKYLDNIQGEVQGNLEVRREVINCDLVVHGAILSPQGTIIGGKMAVTGMVEVTSLGSGAGVATELVLGSVPKLEPIVDRLEKLTEQLVAKKEAVGYEMSLVGKKKESMMTPTDRERQTELMFEQATSVAKLNEGVIALDMVRRRIREQRTINLTVYRKLFAGVTLTVNKQSFTVNNDVSGPIKVFMNQSNEVVYSQNGSEAASLVTIAELKAAAVS